MPSSGRRPTRISSRPSASGCTRASSTICSRPRRPGRGADPWVVAEYALHAYQAHDQAARPRRLGQGPRGPASATAYREALGHAERAIELWPRVDDASGRTGIAYVDLLALAARIASATNEREHATALLQAALLEDRTDTDPERRTELLVTLHEIAWEAEDFDASAAAAEEAYALVGQAAPSRAKSLALLRSASTAGGPVSSVSPWRCSTRQRPSVRRSATIPAGRRRPRPRRTRSPTSAGSCARPTTSIDRCEPGGPVDDRLELIMADVDRSLSLWAYGRFDDAVEPPRPGWRAPRDMAGSRGAARSSAAASPTPASSSAATTRSSSVTRPGIAGDGIPHTISHGLP